ncbi:hypothetical protein BDN72DRAFT_148293 [Pluteus cervinus]|uniref:Uncharacterized protein n=1 Tax=Pluteus cervinus TaxID=181527 RepID=A0ACD3AKW4_9AGAR|nr:hypothetical protein BDN72DRAFT_148293 [Pluteus cervinus]
MFDYMDRFASGLGTSRDVVQPRRELTGRVVVTIKADSRSLKLACLNFATVTLTGLSIAISLCYLLHRSRTGFLRTDSTIRVLMVYTVNTGGIVALGALVMLSRRDDASEFHLLCHPSRREQTVSCS